MMYSSVQLTRKPFIYFYFRELIVGSSNNGSNEEEANVDCSGKLQKAHAIISRMETKSTGQIQDTRQFVPGKMCDLYVF